VRQPLRPAHAFLSSTASWKLGVPRHKRYLRRFSCRRQAAGSALSVDRARPPLGRHYRPTTRRSRCSTALTCLNDGSSTRRQMVQSLQQPLPLYAEDSGRRQRGIARISAFSAASATCHAAGSLLPPPILGAATAAAAGLAQHRAQLRVLGGQRGNPRRLPRGHVAGRGAAPCERRLLARQQRL